MENGQNKHKDFFYRNCSIIFRNSFKFLLNVWFGAYLENTMDRKVSVSVGF